MLVNLSVAAWKRRGFDPEIGDDEIVTDENFLRRFAPLFLLETRHEALEAMKEGLTLGGTVDIKNIFRFMPLEFVSKFLFSNTTYTVESVVDVIKIDEDDDDGGYTDEIKDARKQFRDEILPEALRTLSEKNKCFLSNFLYFVTGSRLMPHLDGHPDYRIQVMFNEEVNGDSLPQASTCANLLQVPLFHYGNDVDKFMEKLDIAVEMGRCAGFGFE